MRISVFPFSFLLLALMPGLAGASTFSPEEITRAVTDYYEIVGAEETAALNEADQKEFANAIADEVAILRPVHHNAVLAFLLRDYRQKPEVRAAIDLLVSELHSEVLPQLEKERNRHPVVTVIDDVFGVWTVVYAVGMGRGLWAARGSGLRGIERFRHVVGRISNSLPSFRRSALLAVGIGTPVGVAHAVYHRLSTQKLDPRAALRELQGKILTDLAHRAVRLRDQLRNAGDTASAERIEAWMEELTALQGELAHLYLAAPQLRGRMQPISMDLEESDERLFELGGALPYDAYAPLP